MKSVTVNLFSFEELSNEAQMVAINEFSDVNIDHEWWEHTIDHIREIVLEKYGINLGDNIYWSLDRSWYFYAEDAWVEDEKKLLKAAGFDLRTKHAKDIWYYGENSISIRVQHFGGGRVANYFVVDYIDIDDIWTEIREMSLKMLEKEYNYLTSNEAIKETIIANEYHFKENGTMWMQ